MFVGQFLLRFFWMRRRVILRPEILYWIPVVNKSEPVQILILTPYGLDPLRSFTPLIQINITSSLSVPQSRTSIYRNKTSLSPRCFTRFKFLTKRPSTGLGQGVDSRFPYTVDSRGLLVKTWVLRQNDNNSPCDPPFSTTSYFCLR